MTEKTKRMSITLPIGLYNALSQWANKEGGNPTALATDLLTALIREEVRQGRLTYGEIDADEK